MFRDSSFERIFMFHVFMKLANVFPAAASLRACMLSCKMQITMWPHSLMTRDAFARAETMCVCVYVPTQAHKGRE